MKRWILAVVILILSVAFLFLLWQKFFSAEKNLDPVPIDTSLDPAQMPKIEYVTDDSGQILSVPENFNRAAKETK